jgi:hypothetical protein
MGHDDEPVTIDRLPNPKWSKQKLEVRRRRALFPWWVWPAAILGAVGAFLIVWFGIILPGMQATPAVVSTPTPTATTVPTQPPPTGLPAVLPTSVPTQLSLPPTAVPTVVPAVVPTPSGDVAVGGKVRVVGTGTDKLRLRSGPGLNYTTVTLIEDGHEFDVLEGPQSANGYQWWRLQDSEGTVGWAVANYLQPITQ